MSYKVKKNVYISFSIFCAALMCIVIMLGYKSSSESNKLLKQSTESQLISVAMAARLMIDVDEFVTYNSVEDVLDNKDYRKTLTTLRTFADDSGVLYIYALKEIDGKYYFVFDTDRESNTYFDEYEISGAHISAFKGKRAVEFNMTDEYGTFNTAAVPLYKNNRVVGIVSVDISDELLNKSEAGARNNMILTICVLILTLGVLGALINMLLKRVKTMQKRLEHMAHYDKLTNLPNRQYLLEFLDELTAMPKKTPFALYFIDLDNFKKVNDGAGHDAGDELLTHIGEFLQSAQENSRVFRPGSGNLNVAARIGGDEFVLILPHVTTAEEAASIAGELLKDFAKSMIDKSIEKYHVGLSIGVALYPENSTNYHVIIKYADIAMYHAKKSGKNCYMVYNDEMQPKEDK